MPDIPPARNIPATTAWQAVADIFSLGTVLGIPGYVARGAMGEVWRLETSSGRWAVKWLFPWVPADPRPADVAFQLAAAAAGIPLPRLVLTADGVGRLLGILHALGLGAGEPEDSWYTRVEPDDCWDALIAQVSPPSPDERLLLCHRDFNPDNLLPAGPEGRLTVLDWENAGPLSAARELGYALFTWCAGGGRFDAAAADALVAGYGAAAGTAPVLGADAFATAIATELNVLYVMTEKWLTEPGDRDYATAMIADVLGEYLADLRATTIGRAVAWPAPADASTLERRPH